MHNRPVRKEQQERAVEPIEAICCLACGGVITARDQKIQVSGSHAHTFFNPAGIVFQLGCFQEAPGCQAFGETSSEFTWFPGHFWRIALCRQCRTHLGWLFAMEGNTFYGLILTKLRE
ncbi:MAG: hypothetical protein KJ630_15310 [Proteobacteria bacterium]|nr:hypothetical protein [Pseudomonadota bacterium]